MFFIFSHALFDEGGQPRHGTGSELATFFQRKKKPYIFIRHSLFNGYPSEVEKFTRGEVKKKLYGLRNIPFPLRIFQEQLISFYFLFKDSQKAQVFIGIDPLNALTGVIARFLGKVKKVIFYTADYARERHKNPLLNGAYHLVDSFSAKNSDQVWCVSTRIVKERKKQGLPEKKVFFVPNSPEIRKIRKLPLSNKNKYDLVIVSNITKSIDYPKIIQAVKELSQKYKKIRLILVGSGQYEEELKIMVKKLGLGEKILFVGRKPHGEVIEILLKSGVGIALYTKDFPWIEFGDSMKVREYLACGLPVIMNNVVSTADDVEKGDAGIIIKKKDNGLYRAIERIFSTPNLYQKMHKNARKLAETFDFTKIVERLLDL